MADEVNVVRLVKVAVISRLLIFVLQVLFNNLVLDYDSSTLAGFTTNGTNVVDNAISFAFDGFRKWDSVYFLGIANDGYMYEQYMAFFPFYPWLCRLVSMAIYQSLAGVVQFSTILLLISSAITWTSFVCAAVFLYRLSLLVLKDHATAYIAALLFCMNPASIFMSTCYTESIFCCCVFCGLYYLERSNSLWDLLLSSIVLAFGTASRSNGILSCGFVTHSILKSTVEELFSKITPQVTLKSRSLFSIVNIITVSILKLLLSNIVVVTPFIVYQWYGYMLYCPITERNGTRVDDLTPPWCNKTVPLSYSYIQHQYWDVGFLRYFEFKQIPNFLLASPMVILCLYAVMSYLIQQENLTVNTLGLWTTDHIRKQSFKQSISPVYSPTVFVYMAHVLFLAGFGVTSMHIQVITRLIASSSPALYWCASHIVISQAMPSSSFLGSLLIGYFMLYFVLGIVLHCNFYPWT